MDAWPELRARIPERVEVPARIALGVLAALSQVRLLGGPALMDHWRTLVAEGGLGMMFIPIATLVAVCVVSSRDLFRAGVGLGLIATGALLTLIELFRFPIGGLVQLAAFVLCVRAAVLAAGRSDEPAAARTLLTIAGTTLLFVGALATLCWWPRHFDVRGWHDRVLPTPHIAVAALALTWALHRLRSRHTRALFGVAVAGLCIALAPTLGSHQAGCVSQPGPIELMALLPQLVAPMILALWIGPALRFLRR